MTIFLLLTVLMPSMGSTYSVEEELSILEKTSLALSPLSKKLYSMVDNEQLKDVESEMCALARVHGFQNRTGMLPYDYSSLKMVQAINAASNSWHQKRHHNTNDYMPPYPEHSCIAIISRKYKFIYIAMPKTGYKTISYFFKNTIGDGDFKAGIFERVILSNITKEEYATYYNDYFKFAFIRNPYSRAVSLYYMMTERMLKNDAGNSCGPRFQEFCLDPYKLKEMCGKHYKEIYTGNTTSDCCCYPGRTFAPGKANIGRPNQAFLDQHTMPLSPCVFDQDGKVMVDFVGSTENMNEDFLKVVEEINKRNEIKIPVPQQIEPVGIRSEFDVQINKCDHISTKYLDLYKKFPGCLESIKKYYYLDFKLFDFNTD